ncbi:hypothetical protein BDD12DRAFT_827996 [Trichophaea hybrida]|nr:hypothetical protein BDD12DRAFT_827996 [Trichophaea hybrida]
MLLGLLANRWLVTLQFIGESHAERVRDLDRGYLGNIGQCTSIAPWTVDPQYEVPERPAVASGGHASITSYTLDDDDPTDVQDSSTHD